MCIVAPPAPMPPGIMNNGSRDMTKDMQKLQQQLQDIKDQVISYLILLKSLFIVILIEDIVFVCLFICLCATLTIAISRHIICWFVYLSICHMYIVPLDLLIKSVTNYRYIKCLSST